MRPFYFPVYHIFYYPEFSQYNLSLILCYFIAIACRYLLLHSLRSCNVFILLEDFNILIIRSLFPPNKPIYLKCLLFEILFNSHRLSVWGVFVRDNRCEWRTGSEISFIVLGKNCWNVCLRFLPPNWYSLASTRLHFVPPLTTHSLMTLLDSFTIFVGFPHFGWHFLQNNPLFPTKKRSFLPDLICCQRNSSLFV